jgi:hypothetical protein
MLLKITHWICLRKKRKKKTALEKLLIENQNNTGLHKTKIKG